MEIATLIFAAIGVVAIIGIIYLAVAAICKHGEEIQNIHRRMNGHSDGLDKAYDRHFDLAARVDEIEDIVAGDIAEMIKPKRRK